MSGPSQTFKACSMAIHSDTHLGGHKTSSRNSSILFTSVLTSLLKVINGGWVPGAKFCRSAGFLFRSTVVTLNTTPLSQRIMKSLCEKGQFPMLSPSLPAWRQKQTLKMRSTRWHSISRATYGFQWGHQGQQGVAGRCYAALS